jgi:hypothetical protein
VKCLALILALLILPPWAEAQVTDKPPGCWANSSTVIGAVESQAWAAWQCRPAVTTSRYWDWAIVIRDVRDALPGSGAAVDRKDLAGAAALRTDNLASPRFAQAYAAAQAALKTMPKIATRVDVVTGKACACDISHVDNGYTWRCPIAPVAPSTTPGPMADCKPL